MNLSQEAIQRALYYADSADVGIQPCIMMNQNIGHDQVAEYASCTLGEPGSANSDKLKKYTEEGWVVFRIQTELKFNGHETLVYLAKMKPN